MPKRKPVKQKVAGPPHLTGQTTTRGKPVVKLAGERFPSSEVKVIVSEKGLPSKFQIIPTIIGGVPHTVEGAIKKIVKAGGRDPDTGRKIKGFPFLSQARQAERQIRIRIKKK